MSEEELCSLLSGTRWDVHSFIVYLNLLVLEIKFVYNSDIKGLYTKETVLFTVQICMKHCVCKRNKLALQE